MQMKNDDIRFELIEEVLIAGEPKSTLMEFKAQFLLTFAEPRFTGYFECPASFSKLPGQIVVNRHPVVRHLVGNEQDSFHLQQITCLDSDVSQPSQHPPLHPLRSNGDPAKTVRQTSLLAPSAALRSYWLSADTCDNKSNPTCPACS